jgi:hypothetical protein
MHPVPLTQSQVVAGVAPRREWFFPAMGLLMLAVVALGFGPSFYLRGFGTEVLAPGLQTLPVHIYAHGIALTTWFLLFVVQTLLVASNRTQIHRRLGVVGAIIAATVVVTTLLTLQYAVATPVRLSFLDVPVSFYFNLLTLIQFSVLIGCGLRFRGQPEVHKRLMFLATMSLLGAAVSRLPGVFALSPLIGPNAPLLLVAALIARDFILDRRLHRATLWGGIVLQIAPLPFVAAFGFSSLGVAIVRALA